MPYINKNKHTQTLIALAVFCGGALGAVCRVLSNAAFTLALGKDFSYGIIGINASGSLLMGILVALIKNSGKPNATLYGFLGTGFLGGFTTFSTVSVETIIFYQQGQNLLAGMNVLLNTGLSIAAAGIGFSMTVRQSKKLSK